MKRFLVVLGLVVAARAQTAVLPNKSCEELVALANLTEGHDNKAAIADIKITLDTPAEELLGLSAAAQGCESTAQADEKRQLQEFRERLDGKYLRRLQAFLRASIKNGKSLMDMYLFQFGRPTSEDEDRENIETFLRSRNLIEEFRAFDRQYYTKRQTPK